LPFYADVSFIDTPALVGGPQMRPEPPVQFGGIAPNPSPDGDVVRRHAPFLHELFDIAIRK
jgi:hypothetical protein